ncbi:MAG TPA: hypothetical protein VKW06_00680 [Candidatus Angelobacter sp.]|nr:hypothetical protein [Candidatus Angelobacter sp.]
MSISQVFNGFDNSSVANFISWGSLISSKLAAAGWVQQNDTGQVVWNATVLTLTQVTVGANAVYSYSSFTGPAPRVGMSINVTGFTNGGNNVSNAVIAAVSGGASGTVTVALTTQVNETHAGSATTTAVAAVPSTIGAYEIWAPGDALQTGSTQFFLKVQYGNQSTTTNQPSVGFSIGSATNGAGTLTGNTIGIYQSNSQSPVSGSTSLFEFDFSYDTDRLGIMVRNNSSLAFLFVVERTHNTDGTDSTDGVVMFFIGVNQFTKMRVLVFSPAVLAAVERSQTGGSDWHISMPVIPPQNSDSFNSSIPVAPMFPDYGKYGNPMTTYAATGNNDVAEGMLLTTTLYGATRTYMASKINTYYSSNNTLISLFRWD